MTTLQQFVQAFGWPHATFLLVLFSILVFRAEISSFIKRVRRVGRDGLSTDLVPATQADGRSKAVEELMQLNDSPVQQEIENGIAEELKKRGLSLEGDTVKVLIRHLAAARLALDFEQIHNLIFGSQLFLLRRLNESGAEGLTREFVANHFSHVQGLFPDGLSTWNLEQYLKFLFDRTLIRQDGETVRLTVKGVDYLLWVIKTGQRDNKPL